MTTRHAAAENMKKPLPEKVSRLGWTLMVIGVLWCVVGYWTDARAAAFNNVIGFLLLTSIAAGALILLAIDYVSGSVWSVPMRRVMEFLAMLTPLALLLALPIFPYLSEVFSWANPAAVQMDPLLQTKSGYLSVNFFMLRFVGVFGTWSAAYYLLVRNSTRQDVTRDQKHTRWNIRISAMFIPVFAITVTVLAVDWAMSLEPHWYSTIFGVYFFSGAVVAALAAATYVIVRLHEAGYLPGLHRDHFYSLGALMFAFVNFWAYIAFSQFLLIWYANLPEETVWFLARWKNGWQAISILLLIAHFWVPYFLLLSQNAKMNLRRLKFVSIWILCAHLLDLYWLVMPTYLATFALSWMEFGFPVLIVGLMITVISWKVKRSNLVPIGDPRLQRGLDFRL